MVTIKYKDSGKYQQVTRNVAHDLVERGIAEVIFKPSKKIQEEVGNGTVQTNPPIYPNRQMKSKGNL